MTRYGITGSRRLPPERAPVVWNALRDLPAGVPEAFSSGSQWGVDTVAAIYAAVTYPEAGHCLSIPDAPCNRDLVDLLLLLAPQVGAWKMRCGPRESRGEHYLRRNRQVLDYGPDALLAFPETEVEAARGSGTWACIREARRRGIPRFIYPLSGADAWREV